MKRMIWALDPFNQTLPVLRKTAAAIETFTAGGEWVIEPVYILSPVGLNLNGDFNTPWPTEYKSLAEETLRKVIAALPLKGSSLPTVLSNTSYSQRDDASTLIAYAQRQKATGIVLNTHSRKGLARLFVGSFTSEMLLHSPVPMLIVNPKFKGMKGLKKILFPTDLSATSRKVLDAVAEIARERKAKLTLFYKLTEVVNPYVQTGVVLAGGGWVSVDHFLKDETKRCKGELGKWAEDLKRKGVATTVKVEKSPLAIADEVLAFAKKAHPDLICMNSKVGPVSSFFVGSVAREVVRQAEVPVWVVHSE